MPGPCRDHRPASLAQAQVITVARYYFSPINAYAHGAYAYEVAVP
ncbi:MAG TPA: hypothetical protein VFC13_23070 [Actinomycetes bacterium]|nr:hypothetical protein [Actinomycetes bacterium]